MKIRISLIHRCGYHKWLELVNAQVLCRAIRRITGRHWHNSNKKYRQFYEFYQQQLSGLGRDDRKELNEFIARNDFDLDGYQVRQFMNEQLVC